VKHFCILVAAICIIFFSCKKNDTPPKPVVTDVYVAGKDFNSVVALWHNGQQLFWEGTYGWAGSAYGVAINDTNVFVAGRRDNQALYWKNEEENYLSDPYTETAQANAINLSGNDIYVAGYRIKSTSESQAGYWKNGTFTALFSERYKQAECRDIAVINNTVYAVGYADIGVGSPQLAGIFWKNGDSTILKKDGYTMLNALKVMDNNVYIAGTNFPNGAYWTNGEMHDLGQHTDALDVDVWNGDVYVAGYEYSNDHMAVYWKNGQLVTLEKGIATGIQIVNGDIYICGYVDIENVSTAVYWKNGVRNVAGVSSSPGLDVTTSGIGVMTR
jgi:hypothetical protein